MKNIRRNWRCFHLIGIIILVYLIMTIEIKTPITKEKVEEAIDKLTKESGKKTLRKHFGKLKRGIDGLDYQNQVRNEWV